MEDAEMKDQDHAKARSRRIHRRIMLWSLLLIGLGAMVAPLTGYLFVEIAGAQSFEEVNPRSETTWRDVREGNGGVTTIQGNETGVLIQNGGENYRQLRNGPVASIMPWFMGAALAAIALVFFIRGRMKMDHTPSGRVVPRWKLWERVLHWTTATLFIVLSITGLSLLFGRAVMIPVFGPEGFAAYASGAMMTHNYVGPFFTICVGIMALAWAWHNIPNKTDLEWFKAGGGFLKGAHPSAGRMNGGEKVWFWFIVFVGGAVCVTGVVLDFPIWGQTRETMQQAQLVHAVAAILWVSLFFGHAYIGTLGTEGAIDGMTTGYTSVEWAKQHHDLWYEEVKDQEIDADEIGLTKGVAVNRDSGAPTSG
jgi:formate dehydrogenase subunit gamma